MPSTIEQTQGPNGDPLEVIPVTAMNEPHSAFFSYSREDSEFVLKFANDLRSAGAVIWMDQMDLVPGQRWDTSIQKALENCSNMLLILSPASVGSTNVMDEVSFALDEGKLVVPVLYRTCIIPFRLRRLQYIDVRSEYSTGLAEVLKLLAGDETAERKREVRKQEQEAKIPTGKPPVADPEPSSRLVVPPSGWSNKRLVTGTLAALCSLIVVLGIWLGVSGSRLSHTDKPSTTAWLTEYLRACESSTPEALRPFFDNVVSPYFNQPSASWAEIEKDQENYFRRFPIRQYTLIGSPKETAVSNDTKVLELKLAYSYMRPGGMPVKASTHQWIDLRLVNGRWKLAGIHEIVSP